MSVARSIFVGSVWMILLNLLVRVIGLVSTMILARLLVPADFGVIAMAMSVIALLDLLTGFGFDSALIQRHMPTRAHYDTVWTMKIALGLLIAGLVAALAVPASLFYREPRVAAVMLALAPMWLIDGFENVGIVNFRKEMNFGQEFRLNVSKKLIAFTVTMSVAVTFRSYWALVAGMLAGRLAGVTLSYFMHPYRPRFSLSGVRDLFGFSGWIFLNGLVGAMTARLSYFLIGRIHGAASLGLYTIASEVAYLPSTELAAPINRAAFPGYAVMNRQPGHLRKGFAEVLGVVAIVIVPAGIGLVLVAHPVVQILLGSNWSDAVPIVEVLALSGTVSACCSGNYYIYLATGRTHVPPMIGIVNALAFVGLLVFCFSDRGVLGIAWADLGAMLIASAVGISVLVAFSEIQLRDYFSVFWRPAIGSFAMVCSVGLINNHFGKNDGAPFAELTRNVIAGALTYTLTICALWVASGRPSGPEANLIERLLGRSSVSPST